MPFCARYSSIFSSEPGKLIPANSVSSLSSVALSFSARLIMELKSF